MEHAHRSPEHSNTRTLEHSCVFPFAERLPDTRGGATCGGACDDMGLNMVKAQQWYQKTRDYMGKGQTMVIDRVHEKFLVLNSLDLASAARTVKVCVTPIRCCGVGVLAIHANWDDI